MVNGVPTTMQDPPMVSSTEVVCRNQPAGNPVTTLTAGQPLTVAWSMFAPHVGDCFFYLSYDATLPDAQKTWFKIAEIPDCWMMNNQPQQITIPNYIPSCSNCILRWEWYSIQLEPKVEFYSQCVDVAIRGVQGGVLGTPRVTVPGNLPPNNNNLRNYRRWQGGPSFLTGPPLAVADRAGGSTTTSAPTRTASPMTRTAAPMTAAPAPAMCPTSRVYEQCGGRTAPGGAFYTGLSCCGYDNYYGYTQCTMLYDWYYMCQPVTAGFSEQPKKSNSAVVAGSLGAVGGLAAVVGVAALRRRRQRQQDRVNLLEVEIPTK